MKILKVVRVSHTEFELEDGRIIPHAVELDYTPTVEEFQKYLDEWYASANRRKKYSGIVTEKNDE